MKLFGFFNKKNQDNKSQSHSIDKIIEDNDLGWVLECIETLDNFPRINWEKIGVKLESDFQGNNVPDLVNNISRIWLNELALSVPEGSRIHESENFMLLTSESDKYVRLFLKFVERSHNTILRTLDGIACTNPLGKFVVVIIDELDLYYSYISHYYPSEGEFAMSGGVFLSGGHGHFVFPHQELNSSEAVASHELTHAMLAHLPIPLWLNEGLAVHMEQAITRFPQFRLTKDKHIKHQQFWHEKEVQEFWAGTSFSRPDDGNELSYQLAQLIVLSLSEDYESFAKFVNTANFSDGGEAAAIKVYGGSLGAVIHQYFGDGCWSPEPEEWERVDE
jgi:hypothetical protein